MLSAYERHRMISYVTNALRHLEGLYDIRSALVRWLGENADLLAVDGLKAVLRKMKLVSSPEDTDDVRHPWVPNVMTPDHRNALCRLRRLLNRERSATHAEPRDPTARCVQRLGNAAGLSLEDVQLLELSLYYATHPGFEDMIDDFHRDLGGSLSRSHRPALSLRSPLLAIILGVQAQRLRTRVAEEAPLIRHGLVFVDDDREIRIAHRLHRLASVVEDQADVRRLLFGEPKNTDLEWADFDHLGQSRKDVESLLRGALERGARGVNILFHGPPGTGKTTVCQVLTERIGAQLVSIGECDEHREEMTRRERLRELKMAQCLFGDDGNTVLLLDEMEDVLSQNEALIMSGRPGAMERHLGSPSKVFLYRLLEETKAPILWTTNRARSIDRAILRRVTYAVEMRQPPPRIRARIWERQLARHDIDATPGDALALAHEFDASPGVAAGATTAADLCAGNIATVRRSVRSLSRILDCDRPFKVPTRFDPSLFSTDEDLAALADRLRRNRERRFSICLDGPPGTGKSAFVRHLADRLGMEVLHKRASDLLGMFVGQTEHNIADAFTEAREDEAFLVFDEADSLLADRRGAYRSWEISQVNEMLTWMESHPLPFACTTNYGQKLDSAVLRRFVFKVTLGFLTPDRAATAFRSYFGLEPPRELAVLRVLTPGDFAVVRRKAAVLGQLRDAQALTAMLRAECDAKPDRSTAIGFGSR